MFDIGFWELLLIGVIALVVIGPERLPGVAVMAGQWVGRLRRYAQHMRAQINEELESEHLKDLLSEQHKEINELRREVGNVRDSAVQSVRDVESSVRAVSGTNDEATGEGGGRDDSESGSSDDIGDENTDQALEDADRDVYGNPRETETPTDEAPADAAPVDDKPATETAADDTSDDEDRPRQRTDHDPS